jgi:hypothetical protein
MSRRPADCRATSADGPAPAADGLAPTGSVPPLRDQWFLSFDCATKSFAYALIRVRIPSPGLPAKAAALAAAVAAGDGATALALARELDAETLSCFHLAGGAAMDLVPGKKDSEIPSVERVGAAVAHLKGPIADLLAAAAADGCPAYDSPALHVAVEFQMGPNAPARTIATVLLTHYSSAHTFLVGPAYKNKLWYASAPELRHCFYVERYKSLYTANKNHSKDLYFNHLGPTFGHDKGGALAGVPHRLRKDFADCVTQVLGFLAYGDIEKAAEKF